MDAFVGLDLGTSSVKGVLAAADDGATIATAERPLALLQPEPLAAEQDPEAWWTASCEVLRELTGRAAAQGVSLLGLGLSGQKHALLPLGDGDRPLCDAVLWCDARAVLETAEAHARVPRAALGKRTGALAFPGYLVPKWLRLRRTRPDVAAATRRLVFAKDWLRLRLTGQFLTDRTEASASLLYDVGRKTWSPELLRAFDVPIGLLPEVVRSSDAGGRVTATAVADTGLPEGLPVVGGAGDNEAAALGCGAVGRGRIAVVLGTSATVVAHHETRGSAGGIVWGRHAMRRGYAATGVVLSACRALEWVRHAAFPADFSPEEVIESARASDVREGALVFVPSLAGERSPVPDPGATGAFVGLRPGHARGHMARAVLEGVALSVAEVVRQMRGAGVHASELRLTSGGAASSFWRGLIAAATDLPVVHAGDAEGPARGAAMLAARGTGRHGATLADLAERWVQPGPVEEPDRAEVVRLAGLATMLVGARNALRAVGIPSGAPPPEPRPS